MSKQQQNRSLARSDFAFFATVLMVIVGMVLIVIEFLVLGFIVAAIGALLLFISLLAQAYPDL